MCKHTVRKLYSLAQTSGLNKVVVITNHLKFEGLLSLDEGQDKDKDDDYTISLSDVKMTRLKDICTCTEPDCQCNEANFCSLPTLHLNLSKAVAFSLVE